MDGRDHGPAPLLGEHDHELLSALGLTDEEIDARADEDVIGTAPATDRRRRADR